MEKSASISKLSAALVKFQSKCVVVGKDSTNPHFKSKYASLSAIIEATQSPLAEVGLAVIQLPAGENTLTTMLVHESGEYIAETYKMTPVRNDPQGLGSAITYQRRYALGAVLNINIDDDDDGNSASQTGMTGEKRPISHQKPAPKKPLTKEALDATLSQTQTVKELTDLWYELPKELRDDYKTSFAEKRHQIEIK